MNAKSRRLSAEQLKVAAQGQWRQILASVAGISIELLDGKGHPCPKCGGDDRFSLVDQEAGAVLCRKCFAKHNGDGLAAVAWMCGCDFPDAIKKVAEYLGLNCSHNSQKSVSPPPSGSNGNNGSAKPRIEVTYDYRGRVRHPPPAGNTLRAEGLQTATPGRQRRLALER
jgi:phage/plasmid primase-like uncharacterized protein